MQVCGHQRREEESPAPPASPAGSGSSQARAGLPGMQVAQSPGQDGRQKRDVGCKSQVCLSSQPYISSK